MATSLELAITAVDQQRRLLADAKARCEASSAERARLDGVLAEATAIADRALAASAANRSSDPHADVAAREAVRRDHAASDLRAAEQAHAAAVDAVAAAERNLSGAMDNRAFEHAKDDFIRDEVAFCDAAAEDGKAIVSAVYTLVSTIRSMRERIAEHNAKLAVYHQLGGDPNDRPRDGATHAGEIYASLHEANGTLHVANPHELRYLTDPVRADAQTGDVFECARQMTAFILGSFRQADRNVRAGIERRGWPELQRASEIFKSSRTGREAALKFEAANALAWQIREAEAIAAHHARLGGKSAPVAAVVTDDEEEDIAPDPDEPPDLTVG